MTALEAGAMGGGVDGGGQAAAVWRPAKRVVEPWSPWCKVQEKGGGTDKKWWQSG